MEEGSFSFCQSLSRLANNLHRTDRLQDILVHFVPLVLCPRSLHATPQGSRDLQYFFQQGETIDSVDCRSYNQSKSSTATISDIEKAGMVAPQELRRVIRNTHTEIRVPDYPPMSKLDLEN